LPRVRYSGIVHECAVPENIHTPPTEGIGTSWGWGILKDEKSKKVQRNV